MKPHLKYGLIVGSVGLVVTAIVATVVGICGPAVALIAGVVAGLLTANDLRTGPRNEATRMGALSGLIAGALVLVGQVIGALLSLFIVQAFNLPTIAGSAPDMSSGGSAVVAYWAGGLSAGACFGVIGMALAVGAGMLAAYLRSPAVVQAPTAPPQYAPPAPPAAPAPPQPPSYPGQTGNE